MPYGVSALSAECPYCGQHRDVRGMPTDAVNSGVPVRFVSPIRHDAAKIRCTHASCIGPRFTGALIFYLRPKTLIHPFCECLGNNRTISRPYFSRFFPTAELFHSRPGCSVSIHLAMIVLPRPACFPVPPHRQQTQPVFCKPRRTHTFQRVINPILRFYLNTFPKMRKKLYLSTCVEGTPAYFLSFYSILFDKCFFIWYYIAWDTDSPFPSPG